MKPIIGIDPGLEGAIAVLTETGELVALHDMPTLFDGAKGRRAVNPGLLASIIYSTQAVRAYCELVGAKDRTVDNIHGSEAPLAEAPERPTGTTIDAGLFARVKDDGRAESCLIAVAGLLRLGKVAPNER
jgi:crossover junction endodeoxyribonuclease RuvC